MVEPENLHSSKLAAFEAACLCFVSHLCVTAHSDFICQVFISCSHPWMCDPSSSDSLWQSEPPQPLHHPLLWSRAGSFCLFYTVNVWNTSCSRHLDEPSRCALRGKMRSTRTDPSQVLLVVKRSLTPNTCDGTVLKLPFYGAEKISKCLTQSNYRLGTPYYWCTISPVNYTQTPLLFLSSGPSARAAEGFPSTWFNI